MEFSRRRRRRRTGGGAGRVIVALIMIGAIVYLISASAAGTWVAKNVMAPVFEAFDSWQLGRAQSVSAGDNDDVASPVQAADEAAIAVSLSTDSSSQSIDVTLPGVSCYTLQMGAFSVMENAKSQADTLRTRGAAGYIMQDGERYRVLASGYGDVESADGVKSRLVGEGLDCTIYSLTTPSATFRVTASEDQLASVRNGFAALHDAYAALTEEAAKFDAENGSIETAKASLKLALEKLEGDAAMLSAYSASSAVIARMQECYTAIYNSIQALTNSSVQSGIDFSAELKYTQLYILDEYAKLMADLS